VRFAELWEVNRDLKASDFSDMSWMDLLEAELVEDLEPLEELEELEDPEGPATADWLLSSPFCSELLPATSTCGDCVSPFDSDGVDTVSATLLFFDFLVLALAFLSSIFTLSFSTSSFVPLSTTMSSS